jgi:hypothetical protein
MHKRITSPRERTRHEARRSGLPQRISGESYDVIDLVRAGSPLSHASDDSTCGCQAGEVLSPGPFAEGTRQA